jgi:hypothetical protein
MPTCRNCSKVFPNRIVIDGKESNLHNRKYCIECSPYNTHNTRVLHSPELRNEGRKCVCNICGKSYIYYRRSGNTLKLCLLCYYRSKRLDFKKNKGGKCQICNYNRCTWALQFHHLDPNEKELSLSGKCMRWDKAKLELDKCILLCSNCHAEIHSGCTVL